MISDLTHVSEVIISAFALYIMNWLVDTKIINK